MASFALTSFAHAESLTLWSADPLTKVFKEAPASPSVGPIQVARGEVAEWQVVVRSDQALSDLRVDVSEMRLKTDAAVVAGRPRVRFLNYVHVDRSLAQPPKDLLRPAPADYPDPLMPKAPRSVPANESQPIWIDLPIQPDQQPGEYDLKATVSALADGKQVSASIELGAIVRNVTVGRSRLWVTNWFSTGTGHMPGANKPGTEDEDRYLTAIARSMAAHRLNVAIISPLNLAKFSWDAQGNLHVDFSRFDDWVRIFTREGVIGRIEGGHIGGRVSEAWESQFGVNVHLLENGKEVSKTVAPDSAEADKFYSQYLPQLVAHLKERHWWDRYLQHLGDEPIDANAGTYKQMAALIRKYAPGMKIIEATHTHTVEGCIDTWVPQLNFANEGYDFYKGRQKAGDEFWTYTCVYPEGEYANRFIELPLIKTRLLHWINFRYGITGYLHWGFNYWVKNDPFDDVTRTKAKDGWGGFLPAGDSWIVYPKDGELLDSIRFETMRDGIADYELLSMLAEHDSFDANRLAEKLILAFDSYVTDVPTFREVRRELLTDLESG